MTTTDVSYSKADDNPTSDFCMNCGDNARRLQLQVTTNNATLKDDNIR
jgi:hypothetical protein